MIWSRKKDEERLRLRFALFPTVINRDEKTGETIWLWLEFYRYRPSARTRHFRLTPPRSDDVEEFAYRVPARID